MKGISGDRGAKEDSSRRVLVASAVCFGGDGVLGRAPGGGGAP